MTKLKTTLAILAAATALVSTPALAQRNLDREDNDFRAFSDTFAADGEAKSFTFSVPADQQLVIQVIPRDGADSVITLTDTGSGELVAEDDDGGSGLDSRIELLVEQDTRYRLDVTQFDGSEGGSEFDIILRTSRYEPPRTYSLALGATSEMALTANRPSLFNFTGRKDQVIELRMVADDLDPLLMLYRGATAEGDAIAENDDSGDGLNSRIRTRLPGDGTYTVRASDLDNRSGDFTLSLMEIDDVDNGGAIGLGEAVDGDLTFAMQDDSGLTSAFAEYTLSPDAVTGLADAPGWLIIDMMSDDMDSSLEAGFDTPLGFAAAIADDDGGSGLNSRLIVALDTIDAAWLRALRLRARSAVGDAGPYSIMMRHDVDGSLKEELEAEMASDASVPVVIRRNPPEADQEVDDAAMEAEAAMEEAGKN